jgi:NhaP-type Na+/H+ or K+/H+ antiporter
MMLNSDGGETEEEELEIYEYVFFFLLFSLVICQIIKQTTNYLSFPYTPVVTFYGLIMGYWSYEFKFIEDGIDVWSEVQPHLLLLIFLPPLIFESASNSDWHIFKKQSVQVLIVAGPMLLLATYLTACVMFYVLGYNDFYVEETAGDEEDLLEEHFSFNACLMFGAIVSATDPVAVVALLKELGASKTLSMLIEGESLLNDGTAMVVFLIMKDIVAGVQFTPYEIFLKFCRLSFGGVGVGVAAGLVV